MLPLPAVIPFLGEQSAISAPQGAGTDAVIETTASGDFAELIDQSLEATAPSLSDDVWPPTSPSDASQIADRPIQDVDSFIPDVGPARRVADVLNLEPARQPISTQLAPRPQSPGLDENVQNLEIRASVNGGNVSKEPAILPKVEKVHPFENVPRPGPDRIQPDESKTPSLLSTGPARNVEQANDPLSDASVLKTQAQPTEVKGVSASLSTPVEQDAIHSAPKYTFDSDVRLGATAQDSKNKDAVATPKSAALKTEIPVDLRVRARPVSAVEASKENDAKPSLLLQASSPLPSTPGPKVDAGVQPAATAQTAPRDTTLPQPKVEIERANVGPVHPETRAKGEVRVDTKPAAQLPRSETTARASEPPVLPSSAHVASTPNPAAPQTLSEPVALTGQGKRGLEIEEHRIVRTKDKVQVPIAPASTSQKADVAKAYTAAQPNLIEGQFAEPSISLEAVQFEALGEGETSLFEPVRREHSGGLISPQTRTEFSRPHIVMAQLTDAARVLREGQMEITLFPEELGRVRLTMTPSEAGMTVSIIAERPETLDLMRRNIELLASDLTEQGFENLMFDFGGSGTGSGTDFAQENAPQYSEANLPRPDTLSVINLVPQTGTGLDIRL